MTEQNESGTQGELPKPRPIKGWRMHPKVGYLCIAFMLLSVITSVLTGPLGLPEQLKHIMMIPAVMGATAIAAPHFAIWYREEPIANPDQEGSL